MDTQLQNIAKTFTPREQETYNRHRVAGFTPEQAVSFVVDTRSINEGKKVEPKAPTGFVARIADIPQDVVQGVRSMVDTQRQTFQSIGQTIGDVRTGQIDLPRASFRIGGDLLSGASRIAGDVALTAGKLLTTPQEEEAIASAVGRAVGGVVEQDLVQQAIASYSNLKETNPQLARDIRAGGQYLEFATNFIGGAGAVRGTQAGVRGVQRGIQAVDSAIDDFAEAALRNVDNAPVQPIQPLASAVQEQKISKLTDFFPRQAEQARIAREQAEATAPTLTLRERAINLQPSDVKQLSGKAPLMQKWIDIVKGGNLEPNVRSAYGQADDLMREVLKQTEQKLSDVGGSIGKVRKEFANKLADETSVSAIQKSFQNSLGKVNLTIGRDGQVRQIRGRVSRAQAGDLKVLQELYDEFQNVVLKKPNLKNLVDFRVKVDEFVNFAKSSREASNLVDPISRSVRSETARAMAKLVGEKNAQDVLQYADILTELKNIRKYTDSRSGGNYLFRLLLSGRGGDPQKLVNWVRDNLGIDLLDEATAMKMAVEYFGEARQKNLFQQEIGKAITGVVEDALTADWRAFVRRAFEGGVRKGVGDPEKIIIEALQKRGL